MSWLAATVVVAALAGVQSFATRDELALIETLARDGFTELAQARLAALEPRLPPAELPLARTTAARIARSAAARARSAAEQIELLRGAAASLAEALAPPAADSAPPESLRDEKWIDALRSERIATLRDLAKAFVADAAHDPAARKGALEALAEARRELERLFEQRRRRADALAAALPLAPGPAVDPGRTAARAELRRATVDAWLPVLDAARLCFDEALLLDRDDPRRAARLRSAREQADQFAWKVGPLSLRTLDAKILAGRAALELGELDDAGDRMRALFEDERGLGTALDAEPEPRRAAAQTWFDALAAQARDGGERERAALRAALPRLQSLGAQGAAFLLAVDEFDGATAPSASADERAIRCQSALLWLRLVAPDDPDHERALLLSARCTLALAAAGHAKFEDGLATLDALASFAAAHAPADAAATERRARLLTEAEFDRAELLLALGRGDEALVHLRPLARTLRDRIAAAPAAADRDLLRDVALALGGTLVEHDDRDETRPGAGTRAEAAELWALLAAPPPPEDPAARERWCEAAFFSIWCLPESDDAVARRRLAEFDAAVGGTSGSVGPTWKRRFDELRARWR